MRVLEICRRGMDETESEQCGKRVSNRECAVCGFRECGILEVRWGMAQAEHEQPAGDGPCKS
jgi:hypothetical protein